MVKAISKKIEGVRSEFSSMVEQVVSQVNRIQQRQNTSRDDYGRLPYANITGEGSREFYPRSGQRYLGY